MAGGFNQQKRRQELDVSSAVFGFTSTCPVRFGYGTTECRTRYDQCPGTGTYFFIGHSLFDIGHLSYPLVAVAVPVSTVRPTKH